MASYEEIEKELKKFMSRPADAKAEVLVLRGRWGVGKTFMVRAIQKALPYKKAAYTKKYAELSLFGLNSVEDIKRTLCFEESTNIKDFIKSVLKEASKFYRGAGSSVVTSLAYGRIRKTTICIDDLERKGKGLSMQDVMGFVSVLKEQRECNIILIMNDGELQCEDKTVFEKYSEKMVDLTLTLSPEPLEAMHRISGVLPEDFRAIAERRCKELNITNLRTMQKIIRCASLLQPYLESSPEQARDSWISALVFLMWAHDNPHDETVPDKQYIQDRTSDYMILMSLDGEERDEKEKQRKQWSEVLDAYQFHWDEAQDAPILFLVEHGYLRDEDVRRALSVTEQSVAHQQLRAENRAAWNLYHANFQNNYEEVLEQLYETTKNAIAYISAREVNSVVHILRECGHKTQADDIVETCFTARKGDEGFFEDIRTWGAFGESPKDKMFEKRLNEIIAERKSNKKASLSIKGIIDRNEWNEEEKEFLATRSVEDYYIFLKSLTEDATEYGRALLHWRNVVNASEKDKEIIRRVEEALRRIGEEHPLQKARLRKYNITNA